MIPKRKIDQYQNFSQFERQLVTFESVPSVSAGLLPEIHSKGLSVKSLFNAMSLEILNDSDGRDLVATAINSKYQSKKVPLFGTFEGNLSPTNIFQMAESFSNESMATNEDMDCYCAVIGAAFEQDAVPYMKAESPDSKNEDLHFGLELRFDSPIDSERVGVLNALFHEHANGVEFTVVNENSIRAVNFRGDDGVPFSMSDIDFVAKVVNVAEVFPSDESITITKMRVSGNYIFNDWKENPKAEGYFELLKKNGREDLIDLALDLRASFLNKVKEFSAKMKMPEKTNERLDYDNGMGF